MTTVLAAPRALLSPVLLGIITTYQPGFCLDMRVFSSVASPLKSIATILQPSYWWQDDAFLSVNPFAAFDPVVTAWYADVGHSRLTKLFGCMPHMRDIVVAHAVYSGNLTVLTRLPVDVVRAVKIPLLDLGAFKGRLDVVKYLHADVGHSGCTTWAVDSAALQGHVDIVTYLLANRREGGSRRVVQGAARYGRLNVVKFFHAHHGYQPHASFHLALEAAAGSNEFAIVSYIMDVFGPAETYSTNVMDAAASNGHLKMVKFLHNRNCGCSTNAMDGAAAENHLSVINWLHKNRTEGCTTDAMDNAAWEGHWRVVWWLLQHRQEGFTRRSLLRAVEDEMWTTVLDLAPHLDENDIAMAMDFAFERETPPPDVVAELASIRTRKL